MVSLQKVKSIFVEVFLTLLGAIFLIAGISKLFPFYSFIEQLEAYQFPVSIGLSSFVAVLLIGIEIWLGLAILLRNDLRYSLRFALVLSCVFIPLTIWGIVHDAPSCGCYGDAIMREPWVATVESVFMAIIIVFILRYVQVSDYKNSLNTVVMRIIISILSLTATVWGFWQFYQYFFN